jgi:AraC-like DNA-binding protein
MLVERAAHPALRGHVRSYYGFAEETAGPLRRREGPGASVVVVISFEHEWLMGQALDPERPFQRFTSFIAGLHDAAVLTEHDGRSEGMQINIAPPVAAALFGISMHELARRIVPLEDVFPGDHLVERLAEAADWETRFDLLEATLGTRLADALPLSEDAAWAWRRLAETHGTLRVEALCEELGWSRKRLGASFRETVGLPPKTVARLLRLERAIELASSGIDWAEVAYACGYFDQSHLANEFRQITGASPTRYLAAA